MIVINDLVFETFEEASIIFDELEKRKTRKDHDKIIEIYDKFLRECFRADKKLNEMVLDKFGEEYHSFVILPIEEIEDLSSFSFLLTPPDGVEKIKKRQELLYRKLCDICFGNVKPFYVRLMDYYKTIYGE